jgi:hypothetical protein
MSWPARLLVALLAVVLPPLALLAGRGVLAIVGALLWVAALGVFFGVAWGPGLLLALFAGLVGFLGALFGRRARTA